MKIEIDYKKGGGGCLSAKTLRFRTAGPLLLVEANHAPREAEFPIAQVQTIRLDGRPITLEELVWWN